MGFDRDGRDGSGKARSSGLSFFAVCIFLLFSMYRFSFWTARLCLFLPHLSFTSNVSRNRRLGKETSFYNFYVTFGSVMTSLARVWAFSSLSLWFNESNRSLDCILSTCV